MLPFWLLILWMIYFLFPFDLFPDFIPGIGWIEDFLILIGGYWMWRNKQQSYSTDHTGRFQYQEEQQQESRTDSQGRQRTGDAGGSHKDFRDPYKILGVEPAATPTEIKRAYRLQANRYHPDKVAHLGEEFQALAKEKFQDIQWAYEQLQKQGKAA
ncbi:DnaJ domain-containing protein [Desulfoferrobacter suflitae]|uniref:DnaJ domain-containing protein n=1 Tax=Desulfoferrobacter suflitae TaxID=2865782 RepID=UPI002164C06D|nr:DnaJ domain-containing protein [Desulfoferrobacter suflitae]MCK8602588.1 DnaJ domain-containing protein [Desulfoferrobacter suflitae]